MFASVIIVWIRKTLGKTKIKQSKQNFIADFKEGVLEFSKNKGVVWLVGITMIVLFFVGLLQSLYPYASFINQYKNCGDCTVYLRIRYAYWKFIYRFVWQQK